MTDHAPDLIRVSMGESIPAEIKAELIAVISEAIRVTMAQYYGQVEEADVEMAVGKMYDLMWQLTPPRLKAPV